MFNIIEEAKKIFERFENNVNELNRDDTILFKLAANLLENEEHVVNLMDELATARDCIRLLRIENDNLKQGN